MEEDYLVSQKYHSVPEGVSFNPDRVRVRGRSLAFNALAANFENPSMSNLSTPPPVVRKVYPKSGGSPDSAKAASKSLFIASLNASFDQPPPARQVIMPRPVKGEKPLEILEGKYFVWTKLYRVSYKR
ncbi:villin 4 [Euphorbia peplus]|nr:villin 4 [Euphorbia peplus]